MKLQRVFLKLDHLSCDVIHRFNFNQLIVFKKIHLNLQYQNVYFFNNIMFLNENITVFGGGIEDNGSVHVIWSNI